MSGFLVYVLLTNGERVLVELEADTEVKDLRSSVAQMSDSGSVAIGLSFEGVELTQDDEMLADVGLYSECEVIAFQKMLQVMASGNWAESHADFTADANNRLLLTSPCILSFNARWSQPVSLHDSYSTIVMGYNLHSAKAMDHRHMVGLVPKEKFSATGYLDSEDHMCIAYEVNGNLIAGEEVIPTQCVYATGVVPVEIRLHCQTRSVSVFINEKCVLDEHPIRFWPSTPMYPFVTLNTHGEFAEPRLS